MTKMDSIIYLIVLLTLCLNTNITSAKLEDVIEFDFSDRSKFNKGFYKVPSNSFEFFKPFPIVVCLKECLRRTACTSFNYNTVLLECELLKHHPTAELMPDANYIHSSANNWNASDFIGGCSNVTCGGNGRCITSNSRESCIITECSDPPTPLTNTYVVMPLSRSIGSIVNYTCPGTYDEHQPHSFSFCQVDGNWRLQTPCHHCGNEPVVNRSEIVSPGAITYQVGNTVMYTCPGAYLPVQNITTECQQSGQWSTPSHCKHCGPIPIVNNSKPIGDNLHLEDEQINYECTNSYKTDQNITSICQSDTTWTNPDYCKHCGPLPDVIGGVVTDPVTHLEGEVIRYTCPESFLVDQNITSICEASADWSTPPPNCNHCGPAPVVNNSEITSNIKYLEHEQINYECPNSYKIDQNITSICQSDTTWTKPDYCKHCGPLLDVIGGVVTDPVTHLEGEVIRYTCPESFLIDQNITSICEANREWSIPAQVNCNHCDEPPSVNNSEISSLIQPYRLEGYTIKYSCTGSYQEDQNITSTCQSDSKWSEPAECKYCGDPPVVNNSVLVQPISHLKFAEIRYTCPESYLVDQNITSTCQADAVWTQPDYCKHCGPIPNVTEAVVEQPIMYLEGEVIRYTCYRALLSDQNITSTCQANNTWTETPLNCKHCGDPPTSSTAHIVSTVSYMQDEVITYTCPGSYQIDQNISSTCQMSGEWTQPEICKHCGPPQELNNSTLLLPISHLEGSIINYNCNLYNVSSVCQANGEWSTPQECSTMENCNDIKICNSSYTDGEYWLAPSSVGHELIKIYCHNMSGSPTEFVSLHGDNFALYPERQYISTGCEYVTSNNSNAGYTEFQKVRIILSTMEIVNDDFTFAISNNSDIKYGEAYGCSFTNGSMYNCPPMGEFHINTNGTGLIVEPQSKWRLFGEHAKGRLDVDDLYIKRGHGDGWCGRFIPNSVLTLEVDSASTPPVEDAIQPVC